MNEPVAELVLEQMAVGDASSLRVKWLIEDYPPVGTKLYTHPVKELHLSLQKDKETGELLAVTYTDDEHRIVEVLWQRPPVKEQITDEDLNKLIKDAEQNGYMEMYIVGLIDGFDRARAILRKAQEK